MCPFTATLIFLGDYCGVIYCRFSTMIIDYISFNTKQVGRSFVCCIRDGNRLLAVVRHASSHRQRWGLGLALCASPLTLGLVLYILRAQLNSQVSLGRCQWYGPPIGPLAPSICYPHRQLSPHPDTTNPRVMACHICKSTQANPLYLPENLIS